MNVTFKIGDRAVVTGTCDAKGGAVVPHPDVLSACSRQDVVLLELAHEVLGEMLGRAGAVTRAHLRQVVREEVRAVVAELLRTDLAAGLREARATVTY